MSALKTQIDLENHLEYLLNSGFSLENEIRKYTDLGGSASKVVDELRFVSRLAREAALFIETNIAENDPRLTRILEEEG